SDSRRSGRRGLIDAGRWPGRLHQRTSTRPARWPHRSGCAQPQRLAERADARTRHSRRPGPRPNLRRSHLAAEAELRPLAAGGRGGGSGRVRRRAQVLHRRPDVQCVDIRGNIETRLAKLETEPIEALILAEAGLMRLNRSDVITEILDPAWMLPAVGQGALAVECRENDDATRALLE